MKITRIRSSGARLAAVAAWALGLVFIAELSAQVGGPYDLTWNTLDAGGAMFSAGGIYSLGGTIGQPDAGPAAGPLAGGPYSLVGGFWPAAVPSCACLGDMNTDGFRNGSDIHMFVDCLIAPGSCACADVNGIDGISLDDVDPFVASLLNVTPCP